MLISSPVGFEIFTIEQSKEKRKRERGREEKGGGGVVWKTTSKL